VWAARKPTGLELPWFLGAAHINNSKTSTDGSWRQAWADCQSSGVAACTHAVLVTRCPWQRLGAAQSGALTESQLECNVGDLSNVLNVWLQGTARRS
jgi:hypothetical protein